MPSWTNINPFNPGAVLTSDQMNDLRENAEIGHTICTSSTRPASPAAGQMIYESDTGRVYVYSGSAWNPPWNTAWGVLGVASQTTTTTNATTSQVDISGSAITATVAANRRIKMTASLEPYYAAVCWANFYPWQDSTQLNQMPFPRSDTYVSTVGMRITLTHTLTTAASGSSVFKWRMSSPTSTSCSVFSNPGAGEFGQFVVEDIGPA